jgi:multidrug efflux pump subunit AcrA (membrane-fusion protein)
MSPARSSRCAGPRSRRIVEFCDCEGKVVAKGDVLVRLDDREQRAQLQEPRRERISPSARSDSKSSE